MTFEEYMKKCAKAVSTGEPDCDCGSYWCRECHNRKDQESEKESEKEVTVKS